MNRKLEVVCSPHTGYCFGVKRAMTLIEEGLSKNGLRIYTIGDVIHNPQAVRKLMEKGVIPVDSMDELGAGDTLIIRAHGVDPSIRVQAEKMGIKLIDTTCPFVRKIQEYVEKMSMEARQVIIIGDSSHPEVKGIAGRAEGGVIIIDSQSDAMKVEGVQQAGVVIQTTYAREKAMGIIEILRRKIPDLRSYDTICQATTLRREATLELARSVDMMLVVGGKRSSNTKRLYKMCIDSGIEARFIETSKEILPEWFEKYRKIGLATGTSTPEWVVSDVLQRLHEIAASI
ncbi:MAG: 4-hydroxy-3-methylbut-2-enyl diphosphate reductase [Candidatus Krumholzibacteria bacterium]|nr:4-hydroxy-3-methylbut-2-enyl diphosphate reductase [Candidatus Krumholzibacteria bacterium]